MIVWMLYSAVLALIIAVAASAAERLARLTGYRVRWIWAGALALTVFLSLSAVVRRTPVVSIPAAWSPSADVRDAGDRWWRTLLILPLERVRRLLDTPLRNGAAIVRRFESPRVDRYAGSVASAMSLGLGLLLVGVAGRLRRARREWPVATLHGIEVRVAPHVGPLVVGVVHPEIVVPRWLLARSGDEQRLVVTHEDEHVRARDPLLLGLAWVAVVAAPWNPALWYMLSRLRLAIELDCDARVLGRGAAPRSYGSLLIDVAQHASTLRASALALADDASHLYQRILAMTPAVPRFARARAGLAAAIAIAGVVIACQATLPAPAEMQRTDAAPARRTTGDSAPKQQPAAPLILIDGAPATMSDMQSLDRSQIEHVDVFKGPAAAQRFTGPDAARGVIAITTRRPGGTK